MISTALVRRRPDAELLLAQAAWDQFLQDALQALSEPNPDLCRDLALDRTIRALGPRPRAPLTAEDRETLAVRVETEAVLTQAALVRNFGQGDRLNCERDRKLFDSEDDDLGD